MNQQVLTDAVGVKREYMNKIIKGKICVSVLTAIPIAKALESIE